MSSAGSVTVVLSANATSFSAAMTEAQRNLDKFSNSAKQAGHSGVTSVQAIGGAFRAALDPMSLNLRALERFIAQSTVLSGVLKAAFPLVGALALGALITKLGTEVYDFIKKVNEMPKAVQQGFASVNLAQKTSTDELILSTDRLDNATAKLLGKPQNNLKTAIDEDRVAMDRFAASIASSNTSLNELLTKNHVSAFGMLLGHPGTSGREGTTKAFGEQADSNAYSLANAAPASKEEAAANKALRDTQNAQLAEARQDLAKQQSYKSADPGLQNGENINIDKGIITTILNQQKQESAEIDNARAADAKQRADDAHAQAEAAKAAAHKAAAEQLAQWESDNSDWKAVQDRSLLEDAAWWKAKLDTLSSSSLNYRTVNRKVNGDIIADNREYADLIAKFTAEYRADFNKYSGLSASDTRDLTDSGKAAADYVSALRTTIDLNRQNKDALAESAIAMGLATGQLTKLDAAQLSANLHTQQYNDAKRQLLDQKNTIDDSLLTPLQKQAAQAQLDNHLSALGNQRDLQIQQDRLSTNPQGTSGSVGFVDALNDFVTATRDAAGQMRDITMTSLSSVNSEIVKGISGQRTSFGNAGAGIFRNVANVGLQKAEGSILSGLGFGGKADGSRGSPLYVRMADSISGAASSLGSAISGKGGGILGTLAGLLPGFADGGYVPANTLSLVGERGPELFLSGSSGSVIPNHQLSQVGGGSGGDTHINVDARGSYDPAQTAAQSQRAVMQAAPHIVEASQKRMTSDRSRKPTSQR